MKTKKGLSRYIPLFLLFLVAGSTLAQAQGTKLAYMDHEILIARLPEYRAVMSTLQTELQGAESESQRLMQDYQTKLEDYQKKSPLFTEDVRKRKEEELISLQGQIQEFSTTKQSELAEREIELMQPLFDKLQKAIDEVRADKGIDMVFSTRSGNTVVLLSARTELDITKDVAAKLGISLENSSDSSGSR